MEDNRADGELLIEAFEELDADVRCVVTATPDGCFEELRRQSWDLVLVDLRLGPHDGHRLLGQLDRRAPLRGASVYVLTSSDAPRDIELAKRHPIHGYLRKPFTINGWFELARDLVGEAHRGRDLLLR